MRKSTSHLLVLLILATSALGQLADVHLVASPKKLDEQKSRQGNLTITTKEVAYTVTVENRTFKAIDELQIKYMIFYLDPKPGNSGKALEVSHKGKEILTNFAANRTATFETSSLKLIKEELDSGWHYSGGVSGRSKDRVTGVWIRAYSNGEIVGEYSNPTTIAGKREWKD
jgi:hypothetical protein